MQSHLKTSRISEQAAEDAIVDSLALSPFYRERQNTAFDAWKILDVAETAAFIQATQPKEWAKLSKQFPGTEQETLAAQLSTLVQKRGALEVLRNGVSFNGINLQLAYFRPSAGGNPEHQVRYEANRFAVMRQVHFSAKTPDQSVDLVVFLNGLPVVSIELKNHLTGQRSVQQGVAQYRRRNHREPFWGRCLVHFAVDDDSVYMTTKVEGKETVFLPFNRDTHNPIIPDHFASSYLWEDFTDEDGELQTGILRADSLLLLIQNYLHSERDEKTGREKFIFPRFHQLMAVRKLLTHAKTNGSGHNYLIQHSAGSGKSNSIAWLAHQLANLCGADGQPVFDSIVVITDRLILDRQLQDTIKQFEKIKGVVTKIDRNTRQLVKALERGDKIIITTLQKFGFIGEMAKLDRRFAIIVDEAHSSQTGENVKDLKIVLTSDEQLRQALDMDDESEMDPIEVELEKLQKARQRLPHLSFFAFTATPKNKTLELFGTKDPTVKKGFRPFHEYTMRQAIDEGFILDVLKSYTTYKTYFELIEKEKAEGEKEVEKLKARRLLLEYVDQHEFAIKRKAHIIIDHFTRKTAHKIRGQAKAMVVTHSRAHAVRYKQEIDKIIQEQKLPFGVLVAFTGTVTINEQRYTQDGKESMNLPGTGDIAEAFKKAEQRILIVANKFQTGFDQPLLHTMYVDKKLGGVAAVQTLNRLNRTAPGKHDTMVLDFVNPQEDIEASFQDYYQCTELEGETNPNKLYNMKYSLEKMKVFTADDVAEFVELFIVKKVHSEKLDPLFKRIVDAGYNNLGAKHKGKKDYEKRKAEAQDRFRKETARYVRQYNFISQIMTFTDISLEKFYLFTKLLLKKLPYQKQTLPLEVVEMIDMEKYRVQEEQNGSIVLAGEDGTLKPSVDDGYRGGEEDKEKLKIIVQKLNEEYGILFDEADRVVNAIKQKLEEDDALRAAFKTSDIDHLRRDKLNRSIKDAFLSNADEFLNFMAKTETDPGFGKFFFSEMFNWYSEAIKEMRETL